MENAENIDIFFLVALGCGAMTLLAGFIIFFVVLYQKKAIIQRNEVAAIRAQHQQELLKKTIEVEQKERERVAKNIHDDLGALISILRLNNSRTLKNIDSEKVLKKIHDENFIILKKTSESLRSISKKLASPTLIKLGYTKALKEVCNSFNQTGELSMSFNNDMRGSFDLPPQQASHLFRASQEIINNIVKHAKANEINVNLFSDNKSTIIKFEHNGVGLSMEEVNQLKKKKEGLGLTSIISRLSIIGAKIQYLNPEQENASIIITYYEDESKN